MTEDLLTQLGKKYGTDKADHHQFTPFYNEHLEKHRDEFTNVMEIGILTNASLRMWEDFFPNATIVGVDNEVREEYEADRVKIFLADQSQPAQLERVIGLTTTEYDMILDDGSHLAPHQYISWATLFKYVKPGGYYIIEDLHCNFFPKWDMWRDNNVMITPLEALESLKEGEFRYQYLSDEDAAYIQEHTDSVTIFDRTGEYDSITAIIKKK
jgi:hypothetical protein